MLQWFNAREATELGNALADKFAARASAAAAGLGPPLHNLLRQADGDRRASQLNNFKRANELREGVVSRCAPDQRTRFIGTLIARHMRDAIVRVAGGSSSDKPIFVVGMAPSGTSHAEQIIASHPAVHGAGELQFCTDAAQQYAASIGRGLLDEPTRKARGRVLARARGLRPEGAARRRQGARHLHAARSDRYLPVLPLPAILGGDEFHQGSRRSGA